MLTDEDLLAVLGGWKRDPALGRWILPPGWRRDILGRLVPPSFKQFLLTGLLQLGGAAAALRALDVISPRRPK